jgi:hypothetical protein
MENLRKLIRQILKEDLAHLTADEYPDFFDGQANPLFQNRAYPPTMNMNNQPLGETVMSQEELDIKKLPYKYPDQLEDFIRLKTDEEIREIAPDLNFKQEPSALIADIDQNYPALFDSFAEWLRTQNL